ncbi:MAG: glycosyltransferase family 61 protein [Hahellaceae bacterium]|nr:glycosyltransferase family 61 protein [Hahellaceae bacterium]
MNVDKKNVDWLSKGDVDALSKLRSLWISKLYIRYFKKLPFMQKSAIWLWKYGYPFYLRHFKVKSMSVGAAHLVNISRFVSSIGGESYKLISKEYVHTPFPEVFPKKDRSYLSSPHEGYEFPEVEVSLINDAVAFGGTNMVVCGSVVLCHDLFDPEKDYTSEELHGRAFIRPKGMQIDWLVDPQNIPILSRAAIFVDACAPNYAHWMTEVLPRIYVYCREPKFKNIPIVVNDGLHTNIIRSLKLVVGDERPIIRLRQGSALKLDELQFVSATGYVPFDRRIKLKAGHSHGLFSPTAMVGLSRFLQSKCLSDREKSENSKIYLKRNSGIRLVRNSEAIERQLVSRGFKVVEPEKLSFDEQVQIFSKAEVLVASSGAALANIIFCPPGAEIYILMSKFRDTSYWYWQNIACATGNVVKYVLGPAVKGGAIGIHSDFEIEDLSFIETL